MRLYCHVKMGAISLVEIVCGAAIASDFVGESQLANFLRDFIDDIEFSGKTCPFYVKVINC